MDKVSQLSCLLEPAVNALGYELWGVEYRLHAGEALVRVYIDKASGITLKDCECASRQINTLLEVEGLITVEYQLEVSSPGVPRPLFTLSQYGQFIGEAVKIRMKTLLSGRRQFLGVITTVNEKAVVLECEGQSFELPFGLIKKACLVNN